MNKVTVMQDGMRKSIYLDGKDISNKALGIDIHIAPDEVPAATIDMSFRDGFAELCQADAKIRIHPESLQQAAMIVRQEFQKKGTWYNALVMTIAEHLRHVPANKGLYDVAYGLADLIIGEEDD